MERTQVENDQPAPVHVYWLSRSRLLAANVAFTIYATALAADTGHADRTWAIWAAVCYGVTSAFIWLTRHKKVPMLVPLLMSLAGALAAPLTWLATRVQPTPEVLVISRSATLLLQHGTPYLQQGQFAGWISYNPYLPVMAVFGLPKALGATGLLGDPRIPLAAVSLALIWLAFRIATPHRGCQECRHHVKLSTLFVVASPVIAFPLAIGITDPPVIALMFLTLALIARPSGVLQAALALGVACAMKATAWPAVPVFSAMLATRDALRSAWRFAGLTVLVAVGLSVAMAPAALANPPAFVQNTVLFPLGLTKHKTPAASPLPGHLLANTGTLGHWVAVGLLAAAGLAFAISLVYRPPANVRAAAWRLAWGLAVMFTLAPATRWGYYVYPLGLVAWLVLTRQPPAAAPAGPPIEVPVQAIGDYADDVAGADETQGAEGSEEPSLTGVRLAYEPIRQDSR
ncbi:MAG: glycosyltransferase 87 family protein [Streptosporangiaceae bacterium]